MIVKKNGTGLGLSISKNIIEDHKGSSFSLKSQEGKGTVFKVTMPVFKRKNQKSKTDSTDDSKILV